MTITSWHEIIHKTFFWRCLLFLVKFSYWSKFHVNIITGSGAMTIFFYKWLNRNPEIGISPVWCFSNTWRLEQVRDTKFGTNVSNEMLLNSTKCQDYNFYCFWVFKTKPTRREGVEVKLPPFPSPRLGLKGYWKYSLHEMYGVTAIEIPEDISKTSMSEVHNADSV